MIFFCFFIMNKEMGQNYSKFPDYTLVNDHLVLSKKWVQLPTKTHFTTHCGSDRPFLIIRKDQHIIIKTDSEEQGLYDRIVFDEVVKNYWISRHAFLIQKMNNEYIYVSDFFKFFRSPDPILTFENRMDQYENPRAWAKTKYYGILFDQEQTSFPCIEFNRIQNWRDPYPEYHADLSKPKFFIQYKINSL